MKALNFWKTFVISALALASLAGCSKNDEPGPYEGVPSITLNGTSATTALVTAALTGGQTTPAVTITSTGTWILAVDPQATWIHPSATSGVSGEQVTFTVDKANEGRTGKVTLTTSGLVAGYPINATATITVRQGDAAATNVAEIRALLKAMNPPATKVPVTTEIAGKTITGVVVSNSGTRNMGNDYLIAIADANGQPMSGLTVNANKFKDMALAAGAIVSAPLTGAQVSTFNGLLQLAVSNDVEITTTPGEALAPITITIDKALDYESQYVKVETCQAIEGAYGVAWYVAKPGNAGNVNFTTQTGLAFIVRSSQYAAVYNTQIVPDKSGYVQGIAGRFNTDIQIMPQSATDVSHLDQPRFTQSFTKVTINNLAAGNYEVDGTIVGVHSKGLLLADNAGGQNNYVMAFFNDGNTFQDKLDFSANMKGVCADRYGLWQFAEPTLTSGARTIFDLGAPVKFDAAAIDAYKTAVKYQYVELTGIVTIVNVPAAGTSAAYNTYDVAVAGTTVNVNLAYAIDSYFPGIVSGDVVKVKGFAIGYDSAKNKLSIMTREASKDVSTPAVTITTTPATFSADGNAQDVSFNAVNIPAGSNVFAKVEGAGAGQFTLGAIAGGKLTVTAAANAGEAQSATLTIYIATAAGAAAVASDNVALTQAKKPSGNELVISLDFEANKYGIETVNYIKTETTLTWESYEFILNCASNGFKFNGSTKALIFGKQDAYIQFPAISGKKLAKVVVTSNTGAAAGQTCGVYATDGTTVVGGGDPLNWGKVDLEHTYTLTGTAVNTAYRLKSTTSSNCQLNKMVLTYE